MATKSENSGWVCLHRSMTEWQHYGNPNIMAVFIDLLLHATHESRWSCGVRLERGETLRSSRAIAEDFNLHRNTINQVMKTLEESGEIKRRKVKGKLVITTIVNYSKYQTINFERGTKEEPHIVPHIVPHSVPQTTIKQQNNIVELKENAREGDAEQLVADLMAQGIHIEAFCKNERLTLDQCRSIAEAVVTDWELIDEPDRSRKHLMAAIRIKAQAMRKQGQLHTATKAERRAAFIAECRELLAKGFRRDAVAEFASYYTQENSQGQMLFETYPAWNTETRFRINLQRQRQ